MKVFDLHCSLDHVFEGWFASEQDYLDQCQRGLLECPMCGSRELRKGLSAPRLNLGAQPEKSSGKPMEPAKPAAPSAPATSSAPTPEQRQAMQAAWLALSREIVAKTEDVGERFAEQALSMHHGEQEQRPIRGQATAEQALELLDEGVALMPLALPASSKPTLQ